MQVLLPDCTPLIFENFEQLNLIRHWIVERPFSWNRLNRTFLVTFPHCVQTESTQHLHCRVFRVMVMLLLLLFFTQSKGGKSIKRCVHGISCWGDDLSIVMKKSGIPKSPKPDGGTKKLWDPTLKNETRIWTYTWILITFVYNKKIDFYETQTRLLLSDYITRSEPRGGGTLKKNDPNSLHTWCWTLDTILRYVCTSMRIISFILQFSKIEKRSYKECNGILIRY